jgi:hypothetical protein
MPFTVLSSYVWPLNKIVRNHLSDKHNNIPEDLNPKKKLTLKSCVLYLLHKPCHRLHSKVLDPYCGHSESIPAQYTWTFWWSDWQWGRLFFEYVDLPYQIIIPQMLHTHLSLFFMHETA